jgi:hypothetical protein
MSEHALQCPHCWDEMTLRVDAPPGTSKNQEIMCDTCSRTVPVQVDCDMKGNIRVKIAAK